MFQPVQVVGARAHGGLCPTAVWTMWGPGPSVIPLASGPQGMSCASPLLEGVLGRPDDGDVDRPAVDRQEVRDAGPGQVGRCRCRPHAGDAHLGDAEGQGQRSRRVVVRRVLRPDAGEGEDEVRAGEGREGDRHRGHGPGDGAVGDGGSATVRTWVPEVTVMAVGTECRPSAITCSVSPCSACGLARS